MVPSHTQQWTIERKGGFDGLELNKSAKIPPLADHDVLVHFYYASLNYRDLVISKVLLQSKSYVLRHC